MIRPTNIIKADPIETERGPDWRDDAACLESKGVDPETFFPPTGRLHEEAANVAKRICAACPSRLMCLEYALNPNTRQHHGVWGGLDEDERAALIKKRDRERDALRKKQAREQRSGPRDQPARLAHAAPHPLPLPRLPEGPEVTLHELPDMIQGSEEWHDQRRGIVTASVVGRLITPATIKPASNLDSRALTMQLAAERITGWTDPTYMTDDMLRGVEDEPRAIAAYEAHTGADVTLTGFMVRDDWGFPIGYSPDGLVGTDGLVECKSRRQKKHLSTVLENAVPAENMAQLQCGLLVSGREWCDYISYSGGMHLYTIRVTPDHKWQAAIVAAVAKFEQAVAVMVATYEARTLGLPMTERVIEQEMTF